MHVCVQSSDNDFCLINNGIAHSKLGNGCKTCIYVFTYTTHTLSSLLLVDQRILKLAIWVEQSGFNSLLY